MRILFIGQAPFGAESLEALLNQGEDVVGVITVPDIPNQKYPNPVKEVAEKNGLALLQVKFLNKPEPIAWVRELQPDLLVLAFVTTFVPKIMIDCARLGGINYHPSLLPKYRGGSAINWALINGETETGVTIHYIDEGVDTGPILLQESVPVEPDDTVKSVYFNKLYPLGIKMLSQAVKLIREGTVVPRIQDEEKASFQPVITLQDTVIDWNKTTETIYNLIRGANPAPGAVTSFRGKTCKLFDAAKSAAGGSPGSVVAIDDDSFSIATGDGSIQVKSIQPPESKKQPASAFAQSVQLSTGDQFGS